MHPNYDKLEFYRLATRYLIGEASAADREQLVEQLQNSEASELFEKMRREWDCDPESHKEGFDLDAVSRKIKAAIRDGQSESANQPSAPTPSPCDPVKPAVAHRATWFCWPVVGALAASFTIVAIASTLWLRPSRPRTAAISADPITWVERSSSVSERLLVTLSDGTKITLNSGSTLSHPEKFGSRARVVHLTGEAFFDVTHDEARPFIIETPTVRVRVLGTQFNVRAFADGTKAEVSVVKGTVQVSEVVSQAKVAPPPVFLTPGEQYAFSPETRIAKVQPVPAKNAIGWMQDAFTWKREPAVSAMRQLERRFGIVIEFSDPKLGAEELNGHFEGASLEEIFDTLQLTQIFDYRLVRNNGKIERVILSPGVLAGQAAKR